MLDTTHSLALTQPNPEALYLASLSKRSARTQADALAALHEHTETPAHLWELTYPEIVALRARIIERYAPNTCNRMLSAFRRVLLMARRLALITEEERAGRADIPNVSCETLPAGRALSQAQLHAMLTVPAATVGLRDSAALALMGCAGLRRAEVCALRIADLHALPALTVRGKGNKVRTVYLAGLGLACVQDYVRVLPPDAVGAPAFGVSPTYLWRLVTHTASVLGLGHVTPHDLRRTYATASLTHGVDLATVQACMGHASPTTTIRYDHRGLSAREGAAQAIAL
jgi:integrase/recombinase XerD